MDKMDKTKCSSSNGDGGAVPHISVTDESGATPPPPSDDPVTPSLPESFLRKLGLGRKTSQDDDLSVDQLPEKEIESKFASLSLAFKTDKLTVEQRVSVQERGRDLAEQNVDRELQGLREAIEVMTDLEPDSQVLDVLQRIRQHIDVLEQAAARVSSRAEVFGAVQQEQRMCKAMEVMVQYTENLRRIRDKEESELQEARKVLSERTGPGLSTDFESSLGRRSMSVCGFNAGGRQMRRRSEVALPRVLGGTGSPSLIQTSSMDARQRFQSAVASTSMQNAVTTTIRRVSLEKKSNSNQLTPSPPTLTVTPAATNPDKSPSSDDSKGAVRKAPTGEDAFRKGFEEGLKAQLSNEFNDLREQQNTISQSLEQVMDRVDQAGQEDEELLARPSRVDTALALLSKLYEIISQFDWRSNKKAIRNFAGIFFVFLAILIVFLSPPISTVNVQHFPKPPQ